MFRILHFNYGTVTSQVSQKLIRRRQLVLILLCLICAWGQCGTNGWTWLAGQGTASREPVYGTMGVAGAANNPGARSGSATWTDAAGNLWLFGGILSSDVEDVGGTCNDLWMYNRTTRQWTWVNGQNTTEHVGIYGTKGVADAGNRPGSRNAAVAWVDAEGDVWLFGGSGYDATGPTGRLNDLWNYDPDTNLWTWVKGSKSTGAGGVYGTIGEASSANTPGARFPGAAWTDNAGKLWLFGGDANGSLNDLWKFDTTTENWTWMKGSTLLDSIGITGAQGTPADTNTPGGLSDMFYWKDNAGQFWIYGGYGKGDGSNNSYLDNLWRYDPGTNQWTWITGTNTLNALPVYGTQGLPAGTNTPGARGSGSAWKDAAGNLWLYAGSARPDGFDFETLGDLWKFDIAQGQWVWAGGTQSYMQPPIYGENGIPNVANTPGSRKDQLTWPDPDGGAWLYSGEAFFPDGNDVTWIDLWKFDSGTGQWAWMDGSKAQMPPGVYGTMGATDAANIPGAREEGITWVTPDGNLWLLGGYGFDGDSHLGFLSDLWEYDTALGTWTWIKGHSSVNTDGDYGVKGVPDADNNPGGRENGMSWVDNAGNLWLLGGNSYRGIVPDDIPRNDLWKYDRLTNQWTWMHGGKTNADVGVYGVQGVPAAENTPGGREGGVTWTTGDGNLWLFGGSSIPIEYGAAQILNDLWKYDIATGQWTWMKGQNDDNYAGVYGTLLVPADANTPGARMNAVSWIDSTGNLWLFGGDGDGNSTSRGELNDLWKYDPTTNQWTWMHGTGEKDEDPTYGTINVAAAGNTPGGKAEAMAWTDENGRFWLFGGLGPSADSGASWPSSDLWMFDPSTNFWIWIGGSDQHYELPVYGTQGVMSVGTTPGARHDAMAWSSGGNFWMFGGNAIYDSQYNDMWVYGSGVALPTSAGDWQLFE